jgi:hypothetical protein
MNLMFKGASMNTALRQKAELWIAEAREGLLTSRQHEICGVYLSSLDKASTPENAALTRESGPSITLADSGLGFGCQFAMPVLQHVDSVLPSSSHVSCLLAAWAARMSSFSNL